jgi:hypothetical protein
VEDLILIETIENSGFSLAIHGFRSAVLMTRTLEYSSTLEMSARVKMLGYTTAGRVRLYGEELEIVWEPFPEANGIAVRAKSSKVPEIRVVYLPLMVIQTANSQPLAKAA